jgi:hypothetical protein
MAVFTVLLNVAGKEGLEIGSIALQDPFQDKYESVELIQQDAESIEDAISMVFVAK